MNSFTTAVLQMFRSVRAMAGRPLAGGAVAATDLDRIVADLETLNRSTEHDFLAVGEQLAGFQSLARRISADMAALTDLISGEHGRKASRVLARMMDGANAMSDRTKQGAEALGSIQDVSRRIRLTFAKLSETVVVIQVLCPLTRIETSRLGTSGGDFNGLSDAILPLSNSIQSGGKGIVEAASSLDRCVQSGIRNGAELSGQRAREVQSLIGTVVESLKAFDARQERGRQASLRHAAQHAAVCAAIEDLVRAIQFHDITRQQIEHVCQALGRIQSGEEPGGRTALHLQSAQLRMAAETFAASVSHIETSLETIAAGVEDMADSANRLMGFTLDERDSFFQHMETCFGGILKAAGSWTSGQTALQSTVSELSTTIAAMHDSVEEIRSIEIQIQRIALNASVRAAHIGAPGDALNVIAGVMHQVAFDSNANTAKLALLLGSMSEASRRISGGASEDTAGILDELHVEIGDLHAASESSFERVHGIATLTSELSAALRSARDQLKVGAMFAGAVAEACGALGRIAGDSAFDSTAGIETFEKRYTMQSERDVHDSVARGHEPVTPAAGNVLGDNIELF